MKKLSALISLICLAFSSHAQSKRYLYVAVPGIRDYLGYGGHGILVFDSNNNHTAGDNLGEIRRAVNGMLRGIRILIECGERVQSQY